MGGRYKRRRVLVKAKEIELTEKNGLLYTEEVLRGFPKAELHRHLEGTFPVDCLYELSVKNNLDSPRDFKEFKESVQFPKESKPDFLTFLNKFKNDWYRSYEDVYWITYNSVKNFINDGIFYIELRFSPEHFALKNDFDREEVTRLIVEAGNKAAGETDIIIKYLLTFNRGKQTEKEMIPLYNKLKKLGLPDIVGIDLAGDETNYPPESFKRFFELVEKDGLYKSSVHAGEISPSSQIWASIKELHAARIGHGISTIRDPALQNFLKEKQVCLEQCITSNYQTGSWKDERHHPLGELYRKGVPVTINSDDPSIQGIDLTGDYYKAMSYLGLTIDDLVSLNLSAIKYSFNSEEVKTRLKADYLKRVSNFKKQYGII